MAPNQIATFGELRAIYTLHPRCVRKIPQGCGLFEIARNCHEEIHYFGVQDCPSIFRRCLCLLSFKKKSLAKESTLWASLSKFKVKSHTLWESCFIYGHLGWPRCHFASLFPNILEILKVHLFGSYLHVSHETQPHVFFHKIHGL